LNDVKKLETHLTSAANGEFSQFAFHVGARRIMTFIVAEGVVFIVNDFSVGIVIPCDT
jgi:hypothetical protein